MKYLKKLVRVIRQFVDVQLARYKNRINYKRKLISKVEYELKSKFLEKFQRFGSIDFYQNYPPLRIKGKRTCICRFKVYGMDKKLKKSQDVLDVGGNVCFFAAYLSRFVKSIDVIENNKTLTDIGKKLIEYENINNVHIYNQDFREFKSNKKYDLIMSLAIHAWIGMNFEDYFKKIHSCLKEDGLILVESHMIGISHGDHEIEKQLKRLEFFKIVEKGEIDDKKGAVREFFWITSAGI